MYQSYRFMRSLSPGGISAADQRAADEQVGRMFAAFSQGTRHLARLGRALAVVLSVAVGSSAGFRNEARPVAPAEGPELTSSGLAHAANGRGDSPR